MKPLDLKTIVSDRDNTKSVEERDGLLREHPVLIAKVLTLHDEIRALVPEGTVLDLSLFHQEFDPAPNDMELQIDLPRDTALFEEMGEDYDAYVARVRNEPLETLVAAANRKLQEQGLSRYLGIYIYY